jgi:hypothetical protein
MLIVLSTFITLGCGGVVDEEKEAPSTLFPSKDNGGIQVYLEGGEKWTGSGTVKMYLMYYNKQNQSEELLEVGAVTNGILTFAFPEIEDKYLSTWICEGDISITPQEVKKEDVSFELYDDQDEYIGNIELYDGEENEQTGRYRDSITYVYASQDARISGTHTYEDDPKGSYTYTYDITVKKGWNTLWEQLSETYSGNSIISLTTTKSDLKGFPSSAKWTIKLPAKAPPKK